MFLIIGKYSGVRPSKSLTPLKFLAEREGFYHPLRGRMLSPSSEPLRVSFDGPESNRGPKILIPIRIDKKSPI